MSKLFKTPENNAPTHRVKEASLTLSAHARKSMAKYVPRERQIGEVESRADDLFARPVYRTGDGDHGTYVPRPGSLVAFTLPSRGIAT